MKFEGKTIGRFLVEPSKKRRAVIGIAALLAGGSLFLFLIGSMGHPELAPAGAAAANAALPTDTGATAVSPSGKLEPIRSGDCRSWAPQGWHVIDQNRQNTIFSLASPDGNEIAVYAGAAIGSGPAQGAYGPQYRTPENFALFAATMLTGEQARMTDREQSFGPYKALRFATAGRSGWVMFYVFPVPDSGGYGVMLRIAAGRAGDRHSLGIAGAAAAAIRCQSQLIPGNLPHYAPTNDMSHGAGKACNGCGDSNLAGTYNAQLGTGWGHDEDGNVYNVDTLTDYCATGPHGPGYYAHNGKGWKKLAPGMG
jgi:hypothetical protein